MAWDEDGNDDVE